MACVNTRNCIEPVKLGANEKEVQRILRHAKPHDTKEP